MLLKKKLVTTFIYSLENCACSFNTFGGKIKEANKTTRKPTAQ